MYRTLLQGCLIKENIFEEFINKMSITKNSGMVFEQVCKRLLEQKGYSVYPLKSYPKLYECGLKKQDLGIDLIAVNDKQNIAVQCKFRKNPRRISWKEFSTFDALCARTGPWDKKLIITTASGVRIEGARLESDHIWDRSTFYKMKRHEWEQLADMGPGYTCGGSEKDMREARLKLFDKVST